MSGLKNLQLKKGPHRCFKFIQRYLLANQNELVQKYKKTCLGPDPVSLWFIYVRNLCYRFNRNPIVVLYYLAQGCDCSKRLQ